MEKTLSSLLNSSSHSHIALESQEDFAQKLSHLCLYSDRLIILSGELGSGRTHILSSLSKLLKEHSQVFAFSAATHDWFATFLSHFQIEAKNLEEALSVIDETQDIFCLIDDAGQLSEEERLLLSKKAQSEHWGCVIVLTQSQELDEWCQQHEKQVLRQSVPAITYDESLSIMSKRMQLSQEQLVMVVGNKHLKQFFERSQGIPGELNKIADSLIIDKSTKVKTTQLPFRLQWIMVVGVALFTLAGFFIWDLMEDEQSDLPTLTENTESKKNGEQDRLLSSLKNNEKQSILEKAPSLNELSKEGIDDPVSVTQEKNLQSSSTNKNDILKKHDAPTTSIADKEKTGVEHHVMDSDENQTTSEDSRILEKETTLAKETTLEKETISEDKTLTTEKGNLESNLLTKELGQNNENSQEEGSKKESMEKDSVEEDSVESKNTEKDSMDNESMKKNLTEKDNMPKENKQKDLVSEHSSSDTDSKAIKMDHPDYSDSELQLLEVDNTFVIMQVAGFSQLGNAKKFIQQYPKENFTLYRMQRNKAPWYVVYQGPFTSIEEAKLARNALPSDLLKARPWFKSVSIVKQEIKSKH